MSIEIIIYPQSTTKKNLKDLLISEGFSKCTHLWDWPNGSLHFHWFELEDYKSIDGVEATIYKPSDEEIKKFGPSEYALHTRTRASASSFDKQKQNKIIKIVRRKFGGDFSNDWYGKNRYTQIQKEAKTPAGRGIFLIYEYVKTELLKVRFALPDEQIKKEDAHNKIRSLINSADPSYTLYNALIPFAVSALETFFRQTFVILLRYDANAQLKLTEGKSKVAFSDILEISRGNMRVEELISKNYRFQNIPSIHKAFKDWLAIDFYEIIRKKKKIGKNILLVNSYLEKLIDMRHKIIHKFQVDCEINKKQCVQIYNFALQLIKMFVDYLESKKNLKIRD